jgi:hypothetical protein
MCARTFLVGDQIGLNAEIVASLVRPDALPFVMPRCAADDVHEVLGARVDRSHQIGELLMQLSHVHFDSVPPRVRDLVRSRNVVAFDLRIVRLLLCSKREESTDERADEGGGCGAYPLPDNAVLTPPETPGQFVHVPTVSSDPVAGAERRGGARTAVRRHRG